MATGYKRPTKADLIKKTGTDLATGYVAKKGTEEGLKQLGYSVDNAGPILSTVGGVKNIADIMGNGGKTQDVGRETRQEMENVAGNIMTGGVSGLVQMGDKMLLGGKLEGLRDKFDKAMPLTALIDKPLGAVGKKFGSSKGEEQQRRDIIRKRLQDAGFVDSNWGMKLASGGSYDIGRDGGAKDEAGRKMLELDFTNSKPGDFQGTAIGHVNPLATILTGGDQKLATDFATYFTKGIMSNANNDPNIARENALLQYKNAGFDQASSTKAIEDLEKAGRITPDAAIAYKNGINVLFGGRPSVPQARQTTTESSDQSRKRDIPERDKKRSNSGNQNTVPVRPEPVTLAPTSTQGYADNFAQNLANIYTQR